MDRACAALIGLTVLLIGCDPGGAVIVSVVDAAPDATEQPDATACPSPNPGPVPCEDALSCPVVSVGSCGFWECPKKDSGFSYCEWVVND
jgi:hypothetical protein